MDIMKKIALLCMTLVLLAGLAACESPEIPDVPEYDKTEILSFTAYDAGKANVVQGTPLIDTESGTVHVTVAGETDLSCLFAICSLSSGATLYPALGGYQDWSAGSRQFTVTSASGKRSKQWTITLTLATD